MLIKRICKQCLARKDVFTTIGGSRIKSRGWDKYDDFNWRSGIVVCRIFNSIYDRTGYINEGCPKWCGFVLEHQMARDKRNDRRK